MANAPEQSGSPELMRTHWMALAALAEKDVLHATQFFNGGLELLVERLGVDRAAMTRATSQGLETCWWALSKSVGAEDAIHEADEFFGPRFLDAPTQTIHIPDLEADETFGTHPSAKRLGIRTYLGVPMRHARTFMGILSVQSIQPRSFTEEDLALTKLLALLLAKTLECETLREDLRSTRNVLDLTAAVVEDHSLESPATRLPNLRYLEIWLKAHLYLAARRGEPMSVARWNITLDPETKQHLRDIADALRGEDLLVDLGGEEVLLLLPHTSIEGAQILLDRIRLVLGPIPMGATIWQPLHPVDSDDLLIQHALTRALDARNYSEENAVDGHAEVQWMLLEMEAGREDDDSPE